MSRERWRTCPMPILRRLWSLRAAADDYRIFCSYFFGKHCTVGSYDMKSTHSCHKHKSLFHELWIEWMSERAKKCGTRAREASSAKQANERANEQMSKRPDTLRVDFIAILPNVHWVESISTRRVTSRVQTKMNKGMYQVLLGWKISFLCALWKKIISRPPSLS